MVAAMQTTETTIIRSVLGKTVLKGKKPKMKADTIWDVNIPVHIPRFKVNRGIAKQHAIPDPRPSMMPIQEEP